ncbi:MAG: molybdopterin-dependent oxidoreductase [Acidobacteria bacterium]|nr:molybdopterin-dependent oxidoreductase [Acidobacteriota bacterium]
MKIERRHFIGMAVGATAGVAFGTPAARIVTDVLSSADSPYFPPKGREGFALSVCAMCPGGCGVRARRIGGRVVKLEGNPLHPVNAGRLCLKGQAALQALYHPDRIPGPMRRVGERGKIESFKRVTWDEALGAVGAQLKGLREKGHPESLAILAGGTTGVDRRTARRFLRAFGSPNEIPIDRWGAAATLAMQMGQGVQAVPAYDLQSCDYVLSLGSALLEATSSPVHTMRGWGAFRQGRTGRRGKFVHVGPHLSITGASADEWISVRPGTEGIFGLGVAAVLAAEGLYHRDFLSEHTAGFEDTLDEAGRRGPGMRDLLESRYGLESVSGATGVSVHVILRIAREFSAAPRSLAIGPLRGFLIPGSLHDHLAAQVLNALSGNLDQPGGVLVSEDVPLKPWPDLPSDPIAESGLKTPRVGETGSADTPFIASDPESFADAVVAGGSYPIETLFVIGADPAFATAAPEKFAAAIQKIPMVVSFAQLPDDTSLLADWILPQPHFLERWDLHTTPPGVPYALVSLAQPALAQPLHDVRTVSDVLIGLAHGLGAPVSDAFSPDGLQGLLRLEMDGIYQAHRGAVMGTQFDEAWVRMMENAGWWVPGYSSADELWTKAKESGGWWDPFYDHGDWNRVVRTRSGQYEFPVRALAAGAASRQARKSSAETGPLTLHLFEPLPIAGGSGAELPFLQTMLDPGLEERWGTWAEIHPETAAAIGVGDRQWVKVASSTTSIIAYARVTPRVVQGVIAIPLGLGKRGGGRWAAGVGENPLRLLAGARDPLAGIPDFDGTEVTVMPAGTRGTAAGEERRA